MAQPQRQNEELRPASGRAPPHDLDAEAVVLSDVILHPDSYDVVGGILAPEDFYSRANRRIYEAIVALRAEQRAIDVNLIAGWLKDQDHMQEVGGTPYLSQVVEATPAVINVLDHAKRVKEKARIRRFIATSQALVAEAYGPYDSASDLLLRAEASIGEIAHDGVERKLEQVGQVLTSHVADLAAARERGDVVAGISTGFTGLDRRTGGLYRGDLYILAARPGMGKSAMAGSIAANVARPVPSQPRNGCAFFSLEMPKAQIATRFACAEYKIPFANVRSNRLDNAGFEKLRDAAADLGRFPLWIDDTPAISVAEIRARVRKLQREIEAGRGDVECESIGLVVVDYLQLATGVRGRGDSRELEVSSITRALKQTAKDLDVPVLALSQLNRNVENRRGEKRPQLSDLRESGAIEQDADSIWFLYRPGYYDEQTDPQLADVDVAKQRNGPTGRSDLFFDDAHVTFRNFTDEYDDLIDEYEEYTGAP